MKISLLLIFVFILSCSHHPKTPKEYEIMKTAAEETAEVMKVDYKTRKLTLNTNKGPLTIVAGDGIKDLKQIKKGDMVTAAYEEALVYSIGKTGKPKPMEVSNESWTARPGELPEAGAKTVVTSTLVIEDINRADSVMKLKNAEGDKQLFRVVYPERLKGVHVGDTVNVKYTEAMAFKVEKKEKAVQ